MNSNPKMKVLHRASRPMRHHRRSHNTLSSPVGAAGIKEDQGNIHPPENPFSHAIQAAEQLIADLSAMNLPTVRSHSVTSTNTAPTVTTSRSHISPPPNPFSYAIQAADQLLADLASMGLAPAHPSSTPRAHVISQCTSARSSTPYIPCFDVSDILEMLQRGEIVLPFDQ